MAITADRDERNIWVIKNSFRQIVGLGLSAKQVHLITKGSPEERAAYVKRYKQAVVCAAVIFGLFNFVVGRGGPPVAAPVMSPAGHIQSLQLHEATFSTSTSVSTDAGVYHVHGGVSAAVGDSVVLKRETRTFKKSSLCVESKIKAQCYQLL